jgi:hypothetical protein
VAQVSLGWEDISGPVMALGNHVTGSPSFRSAMSLVRLRLATPQLAPRLACRKLSSRETPPQESASTPQAPSPKPKSTAEFLDMLSSPPNPQSYPDYEIPSTTGGQAALRKTRFDQPDDENLTRPLRPGVTDQVYHLHVKSTNNNTLITLTDPQGGALKGRSASGGTVGFKGVGKSGARVVFSNEVMTFDMSWHRL